MKNKEKGFTLIELLAVIIILGVIMLIAIPSVTKYINDSRKKTYITTTKEIISGARTKVNEGTLEMFNQGATYYIPTSCIKTENSSRSPYGEFTIAYVVVTYHKSGYDYYWTGTDASNMGIKNITAQNKLDVDDIEPNVKDTDISTNIGIDDRETIILFNNDCTARIEKAAETFYDSATGTVEEKASSIIRRVANHDGQLSSVGDNIYIFKGGTPNNYVNFNGETWRVLGIYGDRLKIRRNNTISPAQYKESSSDSSAFSTSYVKSNLNNSFYNSLSSESKKMIDNGIWYVGTCQTSNTAPEAYQCAKTLTDTAKVGLISSYEFLYASSGEGCENVQGKNGSFDAMCGKKANNWITNNNTWTLNPNGTTSVLYIHSNGMIHANTYGGFTSMPVVYLKADVKIASGNGSSSSPYKFNLEV